MCATQSPVPPPAPSGTPSVSTPAASDAAPQHAARRAAGATPAPSGTAATASGHGGSAVPAVPAPPPAPEAAAAAPDTPASPGAIEAGVAALADSLSACADALHQRLLQAIQQRRPAPRADAVQVAAQNAGQDLAQGITQGSAQALFDQEVLLRQSANTLYVHAAVLATSGLDSARAELLAVTDSARDTLRHVANVQALVALTADLVMLAGALAAGQPAQWPAAIRQVRDRVTTLRQAGPG